MVPMNYLLVCLLSIVVVVNGLWNEFFLSPGLDKLDQTGHIRNRTAILITGQLRSGNVSFLGGGLHHTAGLAMFGSADPVNAIQTQIEWMMKPLTEWGGIDVFMYQEAHPEDSDYVWDGNPLTFRTKIGDTTACKPYSDSPIFQNGTGNRFFCLVEPEFALMNEFVKNFSTWTRYTYNVDYLNEQALRQYYSMYRVNLAAKQFAAAYGVHYTYKMRLRPDTAFVRTFPNPSTMKFRDTAPNCHKHVYYPNYKIYSNGNQDWFNFGLAQDMDHVMDRYMDLTTEIFYGLHPGKNDFNLEDHLTQTMYDKYGICMTDHVEIWMVVIRVEHHRMNSWRPPPITNDWTLMSTSDFNAQFQGRQEATATTNTTTANITTVGATGPVDTATRPVKKKRRLLKGTTN